MDDPKSRSDPFQEKKLQRLQLSLYLIPIIGFMPALWTLYRHQGNSEQQKISRLSVTLTLSWLLVYSLLWLGALQTADLFSFRLLFSNSMVTSSYFLVSLGLMVRLWQRRSTRLPLISYLAEGVVRKVIR